MAVYRESGRIAEEPGAVETPVIVLHDPPSPRGGSVLDGGAVDEPVVVAVAPYGVVRYGPILVITIFVLYPLGRLF